jgi:uncharacterized protein YabN with tetrapyrrole methylase and pyrophosphatase domain
MKGVLSYIDHKTQNLRRELTETIEKAQMELQIVEVSLDTRVQDFDDKITSITEDITSNERKFQFQLEKVKAVPERVSRPAACASTLQPPTSDRTISWAVFRRQFEIIAEHTHWSHEDKAMYLITTLKGWAADVLHGILNCSRVMVVHSHALWPLQCSGDI